MFQETPIPILTREAILAFVDANPTNSTYYSQVRKIIAEYPLHEKMKEKDKVTLFGLLGVFAGALVTGKFDEMGQKEDIRASAFIAYWGSPQATYELVAESLGVSNYKNIITAVNSAASVLFKDVGIDLYRELTSRLGWKRRQRALYVPRRRKTT